jgi:hypothetical protein
MRVVYSFVVDGNPRFAMQATNLIFSLRAMGVSAGDIIANVTPTASIYRARLERLGAVVRDIPHFADKKYCNKVVQLRNAPSDADWVVCCDTDILFLTDIRGVIQRSPGHVQGKLVDFANPPIEVFSKLLSLYPTLAVPEVTCSDVDGKQTYCGNFNGGLYVIPGSIIPHFRRKWEEIALMLYQDERVKSILGEYAWHIDQMSFCLAVRALNLPTVNLGLEFNFPLHCSVPPDRETAIESLRIIHYHTAVDENGLPSSALIRKPELRRQIENASENLRTLWYLDSLETESRKTPELAFVMGFHRSGTSLLAAACCRLGYSIGKGPVFGGNIDNVKGYFENKSVVRINEHIFKLLESDWDDVFFSYQGRYKQIVESVISRISELMEREFPGGESKRYVIKDPRLMQTFAAWRSALRFLNFHKLHIIYTCRNPIDCALSQAERHKQSFKQKADPFHYFGKELIETLLLWYVYNVRCLLSIAEERTFFVRYSDLMDSTAQTLTRLGEWTGNGYEDAQIKAFSEEFVERDLRHHRSTSEELKGATEQFPFIYDLYLQLDKLCNIGTATRVELGAVLASHKEPFAELLNLSFLGRLFSGAKRHWIDERRLRQNGPQR